MAAGEAIEALTATAVDGLAAFALADAKGAASEAAGLIATFAAKAVASA